MVVAGKKSIIKRTVRHMSPGHMLRARISAHTVQKIADKYGLIYFGAVDPRKDDYNLLRGFTVSRTQIDSFYTVGTVQGYDVSFVLRNDIMLTRDQHERRCHWFIVAIRLHADSTLPHFYVGPQASNGVFESTYPQLKQMLFGTMAEYPQKFVSNFSVYARPSDIVGIEQLFPPAAAQVTVSHFGDMSFEIEDNLVYVYSESRYPNAALVETMLQNAMWLAKTLDTVSAARVILDQE